MIRRYKESDLPQVKKIAHDNAKDTLLNIEEIIDSNTGRVLVEDRGGLCGFAFFQPFHYGKRLDLCIVVDAKMRNQGIGSGLYSQLIKEIDKKYSPESYEVRIAKDDLPGEKFAKKYGFLPWFDYDIMTYNEELLPTPLTVFEPYEDQYYDSYYELLGQAFYDLRKGIDARPHKLMPNGDREAMFQSETYLAVNTQNQPIGAVTINGNHIDDLAVLPEAQGLGFGRQLAIFATNKALLSPDGFAVLDVLSCNEKAQELYKSLGYKKQKSISVLRRNL